MRGGDSCQPCATKCALVVTGTRRAILRLAMWIRDQNCPRLTVEYVLRISILRRPAQTPDLP